jgi:hypothetical protein
MRINVYTILRMIGVTALVLGALAVTVSRLVPEADASIEARHARPGWVGCSAMPGGRPSGKALLIDPEKEQIQVVRLPRGESLDQATGSPWINDAGHGEVVGRWVKVERDIWTGTKTIEDGLARFSLPDGKPLDRIATTLMPASPPSWSPDGRRLVIYPSGDGRLYRVEFPPQSELTSTIDPDTKPAEPTALTWACVRPGDGSARILDASWPTDPELKGLVLASVLKQETIGGKVVNRPPQLWWLKLDTDARAIVAAGPLTGRNPGLAERFPRLVRDPSDGLQVAYLITAELIESARLSVAPLRFDPGQAGPLLDEGQARTLARDCLLDAPVPTTDGRSISIIQRGRAGQAGPPCLVTLNTTRSK